MLARLICEVFVAILIPGLILSSSGFVGSRLCERLPRQSYLEQNPSRSGGPCVGGATFICIAIIPREDLI